jgi:hypothetical protein
LISLIIKLISVLDYNYLYLSLGISVWKPALPLLFVNSRGFSNKGNINNDNSTAIILWGSTMGLSIGQRYISPIVRNMYQFTPFQFSVIFGLLLSDGWLNFRGKQANASFGLEQSYKHFGFFWNVFIILAPFMAGLPFLRIRTLGFNRPGVQTITYTMSLLTRNLPCITSIYNIFYINGIKIIPLDIYHYFNAVVFAYWIMGDGSLHKEGGLILCTDSFTIEEIILLINVLIIKYNLICSIHNYGGKKRIYISVKSMPIVRSLVSPYIVPSMLYKIGLTN